MKNAPLPSLKKRWHAWWDARLPKSDELTLTHRNLYILPTKTGWLFALVLSVLLLASINERVNLGYGLVFLLGSSALAAAHLTHGNVQGMKLRFLSIRSVHAGDSLQLKINLRNPSSRKGRWGVQISVTDGSEQQFELLPGGETMITLDTSTLHRGWMAIPKLTITSGYPLGFFRVWAYWRPKTQALIWPALDVNAPPLPQSQVDTLQGKLTRARSGASEMPEALRDYQRGDPLRWIAWKKSIHALASGGGLVSRIPEQSRSDDLWLDYEQSEGLRGLSQEARLSRLASWIRAAEDEAHPTGVLYGLKLPGVQVACGRGVTHLHACMDALATWSGAGSGRFE